MVPLVGDQAVRNYVTWTGSATRRTVRTMATNPHNVNVAIARCDLERLVREHIHGGVLPGQLLEELLEVITLKRLGQFLGPIVLLNTNAYYDRFAAFLENAVAERFMSPRHIGRASRRDGAEILGEAIPEAPAWSEDARQFAAVRS